MKLIMIIGLFFSINSWAEVAQLKDISSSRQSDAFQVDLHFDKSIEESGATVDFINETVQINIPEAKIDDKKFLKIDDEKVKNFYTYQTDKGLRHRIILKSGLSALKYEGKVQLSHKGKTLSVTLQDEHVSVAGDDGLSAILKALPEKTKMEKRRSESAKVVEQPVVSKQLTEDEEALFQAVKAAEEITEKAVETKESKIPAFKEVAKEASSEQSTYTRMVLSLFIVLVLGGVAYFGVKKYSHKQLSKNKHTSIRVMTQHYLGPKKSLAIVTVAGESILIGITDHNITPIKTLSLLDEEVPEVTGQSFEESLKTESAMAASSEESAEEEFSIQGLKDIVKKRLDGMRHI